MARIATLSLCCVVCFELPLWRELLLYPCVVWFDSAAATARIAIISLCSMVCLSGHYGKDCYYIPVLCGLFELPLWRGLLLYPCVVWFV